MNSFGKKIIKWHHLNGRKDLPWQKNVNPYRVWISEIILQQTQVKIAIPYFDSFIERFPNIDSIANSNEDEILSYWSGLGYYQRARNLYKSAIIMQLKHNSKVPDNMDSLLDLPGIGRSTAGAILSLGFEKKAPLLDGNVKRVLSRYSGLDEELNKAKSLNFLWELSENLLPKTNFRTYNQALMDLGALVCLKNNPKCYQCPLSNECISFKEDIVYRIPKTNYKPSKRRKNLKWLILHDKKNNFLLQKNPTTGIWPGLWSFIEAKDLNALLQPYNGYINKKVKKYNEKIKIDFSHLKLEVDLYFLYSSKIKIKSKKNQSWINKKDLPTFGIPGPVLKIIQEVKEYEKESILQKI